MNSQSKWRCQSSKAPQKTLQTDLFPAQTPFAKPLQFIIFSEKSQSKTSVMLQHTSFVSNSSTIRTVDFPKNIIGRTIVRPHSWIVPGTGRSSGGGAKPRDEADARPGILSKRRIRRTSVRSPAGYAIATGRSSDPLSKSGDSPDVRPTFATRHQIDRTITWRQGEARKPAPFIYSPAQRSPMNVF